MACRPFFTRTAPNTLPETDAWCPLMKKLALSRYAVEVHLQHIAQKQETAATEVPPSLQPYTNLTQSTMKCALPAPSSYSANLWKERKEGFSSEKPSFHTPHSPKAYPL